MSTNDLNNVITAVDNFIKKENGFELLKSAIGRRLSLHRDSDKDVGFDFDKCEIQLKNLNITITPSAGVVIPKETKITEDFIISFIGELVKNLEYITKTNMSKFFIEKLAKI